MNSSSKILLMGALNGKMACGPVVRTVECSPSQEATMDALFEATNSLEGDITDALKRVVLDPEFDEEGAPFDTPHASEEDVLNILNLDSTKWHCTTVGELNSPVENDDETAAGMRQHPFRRNRDLYIPVDHEFFTSIQDSYEVVGDLQPDGFIQRADQAGLEAPHEKLKMIHNAISLLFHEGAHVPEDLDGKEARLHNLGQTPGDRVHAWDWAAYIAAFEASYHEWEL